MTKDTRHTLFGEVAGGAGSTAPEKNQRSAVVAMTGLPCPKTDVRINLRTNTLKEISRPNVHDDGFDYSEDFDGCQLAGEKTIFINFKCIVGKGGAQTRSLREVYWFIEGQLRVLLTGVPNVCFANILDGDEPHRCLPKFKYLLALPEFADVAKYVYVGDLKGYKEWFTKTTSP